MLEQLEFPEPVIHVAVEPKTKADQDKMGKALYSLSEEDPTFQVRTDEETGQTIISGMGELHLEVLVDRMLREFSVDATVGKPQVAYRETITAAGREGRLPPHQADRRLGPVRRRRASTSSPPGPAAATSSSTRSPAAASRKEYIPAVDQGIQERSTAGVLAGYPTVDVRATPRRRLVPRRGLLRDGVQDRRLMAFKEAARKAKPVLLEPIMAVEVVTPEDYMGDVMGDLSTPAAGRVGGMEQRGNSQVIRGAGAPVGDVRLRYRPTSRTQGRATYTMQFDSYQQMPATIQDEIVARVRGE